MSGENFYVQSVTDREAPIAIGDVRKIVLKVAKDGEEYIAEDQTTAQYMYGKRLLTKF